MKGIKVAFAHGINGEFGNKGGLPWGAPLKKDMEAFVEFTKDCILVMGYNTFSSLPRNLNDHGRKTAVFCANGGVPKAGNGDLPDCVLMIDDDNAIQETTISMLASLIEDGKQDAVVIGGAALLESVVWYADEILCTTINPSQLMEYDVRTHLSPEYIEALPERYHSRNGIPIIMAATEYKKNMVRDIGRNMEYTIRHYKFMEK